MRKRIPLRADSFTLVELLVVVAVITILAFLTAPALMGVLGGSNLTTGSNLLASQLDLCRQSAITRNCKVEFRFYQLPASGASGAPTAYRAFQGLSLDNGGAQTNAITKVTFLPGQVVMSANATSSTLLTTGNPPYSVAGTTAGSPLGPYPPSSYNYVAFHFNADGSTDLNPNLNSFWVVSLANATDPVANAATGLPANFITLQVEALTGACGISGRTDSPGRASHQRTSWASLSSTISFLPCLSPS